MTEKINKRFDNLLTALSKEVSSQDKMKYFYRVFKRIYEITYENTITNDISSYVQDIYGEAVKGHEDTDWDEVLDAFLSVYPKIYDKIVEENKQVQILEDIAYAGEFNQLTSEMSKRYNPADYRK